MKITINGSQSYHFDKTNVTIGRSTQNSIPLDDTASSRNHCVIEYREGQYWITDLQSFNGTKLNSEPVTSHRLKEGDKIQIGKSVLLISEIDKVKKLKETGRISRARRRLPVRSSQGAIIVAVCVVVTLLWLGKKIYRQYLFHQENQQLYAQALGLEKKQEYDAAISLFREVIAAAPGSVLEKKAGIAIARIREAIAFERKVDHEFTRLAQRYKDRELSTEEYLQELSNFARRLENHPLRAKLVKERKRVEELHEQEMAQIFRETERMANTYLEDEIYVQAREYYRRFIDRYPENEWAERAVEAIEKIRRKVDQKWREVLDRIDFLRGDRLSEAVALAESSRSKFKGTVWEEEAAELARSLRHTLSSRQNAAQEKERFLAQHVLSQDVRKNLRKGLWEKAIALLQEIAAKVDGANRQIAQGFVADIERIVALEQKFFENWRGGSTFELAGKKSEITSIENGHLRLRLENETGTVTLRWRDLPASMRLDLFDNSISTRDDHFALACFSIANSMMRQSQRFLVETIVEHPRKKPEVDDFWSRWSGTPVPESGFLVYKERLVTPEEKFVLEATEKIRKLSEVGAKASPRALTKELNDIHAQIIGRQRSEEVEDLFRRELLALRRVLVEAVKRRFDFSAIKYLRKLKAELDERRRKALALIFDEVAYPNDETHGSEAQPEVDELVAAVGEIWQTPSKSVEKLSPKILQWKQLVRVISAFLEEKYPEQIDVDDEIASLDAIVDSRLSINIQNYAESSRERQRISYNRRIFRENAEKQSNATAAEREQVKITNQYRHMMGRYCLRLDDELTTAARKHSAYLNATGIFAHIVPGEPEGASPMQRAQKAGYSGAVGENIFKGDSSPKQAHNAWLHSAGHHRNILNPKWRALGAGNAGDHWTQNFGSK